MNLEYHTNTMQANQMSELQYLLQSNLDPFPNPLYQLCSAAQEPSPKWACLSSNSTTSDEAEEMSIINERKQRRMISNRESARRSRMRKQRHLDELWSQVVCLRNENQHLMEKLNHALETHDRLLRENAQVKEEASELRHMLANMHLNPNHLPSTSQFH
ncbi:basic leucine zipper 43-like [Salvia miltiorrhiza]|uniref:basic leucine zipper 43-like n=1 Tax=Salvia miltiorrhiza TaxID=226208 RepID=UPI0025AC1487|nr:basic leucine zipper 43-like [Salvia miltiorrhiza]